MGSTKYLMSMGELSRKDNSLCFRKNNKNTYIPIENVKEIYCLSEISLNTKLLDFIAHNNIVMHFFNYYGGYSGTFYPKESLVSGRLLVKQVEAYKNRRIEIAKEVVRGIGENIHEVMYHYYKHDIFEVKELLDWIKGEFQSKLDNVQDIKSLLQIEGEIGRAHV